MNKLVVAPDVENDFREAYEWYESRRLGLQQFQKHQSGLKHADTNFAIRC